jgi:hypothetical protein
MSVPLFVVLVSNEYCVGKAFHPEFDAARAAAGDGGR